MRVIIGCQAKAVAFAFELLRVDDAQRVFAWRGRRMRLHRKLGHHANRHRLGPRDCTTIRVLLRCDGGSQMPAQGWEWTTMCVIDWKSVNRSIARRVAHAQTHPVSRGESLPYGTVES